MNLSDREIKILNYVIEDYIRSVKPVSSKKLKEKYHLKISSATIRLEMQKLGEKKLIYQPYTSAGRIPTDKGYRVFVDKVLKEKIREVPEKKWIKEFSPKRNFLQILTQEMAFFSGNLVINFSKRKKIVWKEGWEKVLKEPEFENSNFRLKFCKFVKEFEKIIEDLELNSEIKIFIGKENPLKEGKDFSVLISGCNFPKWGETILSLLGPKRMDYNKNIKLLSVLKNYFN